MAEKTTSEKLAEAKDALHTLILGKSEASITYRERAIVFRATDIERLKAYIQQLTDELAVEGGECVRSRSYVVSWGR